MGVKLMATYPRMPGKDWQGGQSAVSRQHPPSTTCECLSMLSTASYEGKGTIMSCCLQKQTQHIVLSKSLHLKTTGANGHQDKNEKLLIHTGSFLLSIFLA